MTRIGVTGANGFIGRHVCMLLGAQREHQVIEIPRTAFEDVHVLAALVATCDAIIHLAGTNSGSDADIYTVNVSLARRLVDASRVVSWSPHVVFASSMFAERAVDNPNRSLKFGESKREAANILNAWAADVDAKVTTLLLPHVFGEFAPPYHNSAVATLCHQIVRNEQPTIREGAEVELEYVLNVASRLLSIIETGETGVVDMVGKRLLLTEVYGRLMEYRHAYIRGELPVPKDALSIALFMTLQYHLTQYESSKRS